MPDNNKYELRSVEVQKLMDNPPRTAIAWGNTLIILLLALGLFLLNKIPIPQKETTPFQLVQFDKIDSTQRQKFALLLDNTNSIPPTSHQKINLVFESYSSNIYGNINTEIDTVVFVDNKQYIFVKSFQSDKKTNKIILKNLMLGNATIQIGQTNFLTQTKKKLFKLNSQ